MAGFKICYIKLNYVACLSGTGSFCHVTVMGSLIVLVNKRADWNVPVSYIKQLLIADLRFVSIYLWQNKRIGENDPSLMRHIYKRFFSKIEELRNYVKKKSTKNSEPT
jgi:hypothetical protein